ncbi:MAG TPA: alpha/beta fold hydrolase [Mycobacteriales bacterium]|nr:alpha/beta fold hydrolase [Mycobacteriales bacterium]
MTSSYRMPGLVVTDHTIDVPLDHSEPAGQQIAVFARVVADPDGQDRPFLVFLQGGPGFEAPRPTGVPHSPGWLERALADYRVVMLDQRGTGRSTPIHDVAGWGPAEQASYLTHFRADAIVRDAEAMRAHLGAEKWSVLGQSFGGFTLLAYLSQAPEGLREAMFTGGLAAIGPRIDDVYRTTYSRVIDRCERFYARYPGDRDRVRAVHDAIDAGITLPSGDRLTARRFRMVGQQLGASDGAERLHYLLELDPRSAAFAHDVEGTVAWGRNPLYALVHEACWADGGVTRWSAQRVQPDAYSDPTLFTGEHVFPWMFDDIGALGCYRDAARLLAEQPWPRLYDEERLAANEVPAAAAIYAHDMYVPREFSEPSAAAVRGLRPWLTSEFEHDGLRAAGDRILGRLIDLVRDRA